jgi:hypothetical protein
MNKIYEIIKLQKGGWIVKSENGESAHSSRAKAISRIFFSNPHAVKYTLTVVR